MSVIHGYMVELRDGHMVQEIPVLTPVIAGVNPAIITQNQVAAIAWVNP